MVDKQLVRFGENTDRVQDNLKENPPTAEIKALLNEAKQNSSGDRQIPHWQTILEIAAKLGDKTEFGYLGVDIVLDQKKGPLLLEINARPGLSIQIANQEGLMRRLDAIDSALPKLSGIQQKIGFAQKAFALKTNSHLPHSRKPALESYPPK